MSIDGAAKERVADALGKLLAVEGMSIVTAPRMFGVLMRAVCPDDGEAIDVLEKVLQAGIVAAMREETGGQEQVPNLADRLVEATGMPEADARWAIEKWWRAVRPTG